MIKKESLLILVIMVLVFGTLIQIKQVKADSGWDIDYDSGSSWSSSDWESSWSSSDWGSSWSSSDWGSNNRNSNSGSSYSSYSILADWIIVIISFVGIILTVIYCKKNFGKTSADCSDDNVIFSDVPEEILNKYGINGEEFKQMAYKKYVQIQEDWMNFDYEGLRKNLTDELYNSYVMQLDTLKLKNQRNIMTDFEYKNALIIGIQEKNGILNIKLNLTIEMYDYVIDSNSQVIRGSDQYKILIKYVIEFVKSTNINSDTICPNCGSKVNIVTSGKCEHCGSTIVTKPNDFVMSKKTNIFQRRKL